MLLVLVLKPTITLTQSYEASTIGTSAPINSSLEVAEHPGKKKKLMGNDLTCLLSSGKCVLIWIQSQQTVLEQRRCPIAHVGGYLNFVGLFRNYMIPGKCTFELRCYATARLHFVKLQLFSQPHNLVFQSKVAQRKL